MNPINFLLKFYNIPCLCEIIKYYSKINVPLESNDDHFE